LSVRCGNVVFREGCNWYYLMKPTKITRARELVFGLTKLIRSMREDRSEDIKTGTYHSPARSYYFNNIKEIEQLKAKVLKQALRK